MKWISVKERLPEKEIYVLLWLYEDKDPCTWGPKAPVVAKLEDDKWSVYRNCGCCGLNSLDFDEVTHWMPLPGSPE